MPEVKGCEIHDALVEELREQAESNAIPRWAVWTVSGLAAVVMALSGIVWNSLAGEIKQKADQSEVAHLAGEVADIKAEVNYLSRKAVADQINAAVNRRLLNAIAEKVGARPAGALEKPRPAEPTE